MCVYWTVCLAAIMAYNNNNNNNNYVLPVLWIMSCPLIMPDNDNHRDFCQNVGIPLLSLTKGTTSQPREWKSGVYYYLITFITVALLKNWKQQKANAWLAINGVFVFYHPSSLLYSKESSLWHLHTATHALFPSAVVPSSNVHIIMYIPVKPTTSD